MAEEAENDKNKSSESKKWIVDRIVLDILSFS